MGKNTKYLVKISFDTNDGDYVYGSKVITESDKKIIEDNPTKLVNFGSCDWGEHQDTIENTFDDITEISEEEYEVLKKLGLDNFGELQSWDAIEVPEYEDSVQDYK